MRGAIAALLVTLAGPAAAAEPLDIVASFSILGDLVAAVGGDHVRVTSLVGPGGDAHVFEPSPADARAIAAADLVVVNGLGFEGWIDRLIVAAGYAGPVVVASAGATPLELTLPGTAAEARVLDPHAWQDPANAVAYVDSIRVALDEADPAHAADYDAAAAGYQAALQALDAELTAAFAAVPEAERRVVTAHGSFRYFGRAYGIAFLAPVAMPAATEASAADVAALIRQIRAQGVSAIFIESISSPRLLDQIAAETGATIGGTLYSDALSPPDGPAPTYLALVRHNADALLAALAGD